MAKKFSIGPSTVLMILAFRGLRGWGFILDPLFRIKFDAATFEKRGWWSDAPLRRY
jgi:hypothetical protein